VAFAPPDEDRRLRLRPARRPHRAPPRRAARFRAPAGGADGGLEDRIIRDLPDFLRPGDALVFNDTRVIPARLSGVRERTGPEGEILTVAVEATLHHRDAPTSGPPS
jgi:S-adenosylmethionine:tRNA ribosyltransferase-isomerase